MKTLRAYALVLTLPWLGLCTWQSIAHAKDVRESWNVEGMHNATDVRQVRDALRHLPGVTYVSMTQATAEIELDNKMLSDAQLCAAVARAGNFHLTEKSG